ncbi:hypothetical protein GOP47_0022042 [Adiantum capillus-veneris]|uniref:Phospholipid/glycerol acyltransferase domain-containing protein n=1 Tax=Adiantum capillus-veneris TaxID=13818 RepID=A0A9D4U981_ADICA|nr:hypothetical protein GOP47_0022042 [Adiantum capillus-veneris]
MDMEGGDDDDQFVAAELEGWLLKDRDPFPYFLLVAMEAGSLIRAIALMLAYPVAWLLEKSAFFEEAALKLYVLIACVGLRVEEIEAVGRAVLPRFLAEQVRAAAWKTFSSFAPASSQRRLLISALPRPMLHSFVRNQLGAHHLIAPDLHATASGRCLGFLKRPPPHQDLHRRHLFNIPSSPASSRHEEQLLFSTTTPTLKYLGDLQFISSCARKKDGDEEAVCMSDLDSPVVFHDGRLVKRPTPAMALLVFLWMPVGFILAVLRVFLCSRAPHGWWPALARLFRIRIIIKGEIPGRAPGGKGMLLVCNHRTLLDPIFVSMGLARTVTAVTYSVSRLSEMLSPIPTVRLERHAQRDLQRLRGLVEKGSEVVVCPEGTTSREALLLRFSALFAQASDHIVPVAIRTHVSLFHGTSARGFKAMDPFFFLMNPVPTYELIFLPMLPPFMTTSCAAGDDGLHVSRFQVANHVQQLIGSTLGFHCSSFTRPDKYRFLAGTDGSVTPRHA